MSLAGKDDNKRKRRQRPPGVIPGLEWPTWPESAGLDDDEPEWVQFAYCRASPTFRYKGRRVQFRFADYEGRMVLVGLEIGPYRSGDSLRYAFEDDLKPLRTAELRLPLVAIIEDLFTRGAMSIWWPFEGDPKRAITYSSDMGMKLDELRMSVKKKRGRPPLYGPEHYAAVAAAYQAHELGGGHAPTQAVANVFRVTRSAAAKWVATARAKYGLLPRD